jgi:hypothetical protein
MEERQHTTLKKRVPWRTLTSIVSRCFASSGPGGHFPGGGGSPGSESSTSSTSGSSTKVPGTACSTHRLSPTCPCLVTGVSLLSLGRLHGVHNKHDVHNQQSSKRCRIYHLISRVPRRRGQQTKDTNKQEALTGLNAVLHGGEVAVDRTRRVVRRNHGRRPVHCKYGD